MNVTKSRFSKSVAVVGGFGGWNIGDEAILYSLVGMLRDRGYSGKVHVLCARISNECRHSYLQQGWNPVLLRRPIAVIRSLRKSDLFVGGGQILNGIRPAKSLGVLGVLVRLNKLLGNHPRIVGVGINNLDSSIAKFLVRVGVCQAEAIGCRDESSLGQLHQACPHVGTLTADLVFSRYLCRNIARPTNHPNDLTVIVAVNRSPEHRFMQLTNEAYCELFDLLLRSNKNTVIQVVAHDSREAFDAGRVSELKLLFKHPRVRYEVLKNLPETLEMYGRAGLVVSQRMHPLILGLIFGTQVLPIAGPEKVAALCRRLALPILSVSADGRLNSSETLGLLRDKMMTTAKASVIQQIEEAAWANLPTDDSICEITRSINDQVANV